MASGPEVIAKLCSTQLSMKFITLIKLKCRKINTFFAFKLTDIIFIMLVNVKVPTIVGILTLMSMINFMLHLGEHEKSCIISGPDCLCDVHAQVISGQCPIIPGYLVSAQLSLGMHLWEITLS